MTLSSVYFQVVIVTTIGYLLSQFRELRQVVVCMVSKHAGLCVGVGMDISLSTGLGNGVSITSNTAIKPHYVHLCE